MKKRLLALCCALAVGGAVTAKTVGATSPGGNLRMEIEVVDKISYTVWSGADKVLDACTLSLTLADRTLGEAPRLRSVKRSSADEMLERRNPTKDAVVRNCYNAVQLRFAGDYAVEFRLFDDWDDFLIITRDMQPDDGLIIVMSHKGLPSFQTGMKKIPNYMAKYFSDYNFILIYPIHTIAEESENRDLLNASLLPNFNKFEGIGKSISKALKAK